MWPIDSEIEGFGFHSFQRLLDYSSPGFELERVLAGLLYPEFIIPSSYNSKISFELLLGVLKKYKTNFNVIFLSLVLVIEFYNFIKINNLIIITQWLIILYKKCVVVQIPFILLLGRGMWYC